MTHKSLDRLQRDGIIPSIRTALTIDELEELRSLHHFATMERFKAKVLGGNTATLPKTVRTFLFFWKKIRAGQEIAAEYHAIADLLESAKTEWIGNKLIECGYPKGANVSINLRTGEITQAHVS